MSRLSDLRAALDELEAAQEGYDLSRPADDEQYGRFCAIMAAMDRLHDLEDIRTIRALVKVAEKAERQLAHDAFCPFCRPFSDELHEPDCPLGALTDEEADDEQAG